MTLDRLLNFHAVLVDIDDTLYDYEAAHHLAIEAVWQEMYLPDSIGSRSDFLEGYRAHRTRVTRIHKGSGASRSRLLAFQGLFEDISLACAYGRAADAEEIYWSCLIANMTPNATLIALLREYNAQGRQICAVTDMQTVVQVRKLRALGLDGIVTHMVSSEEVGVEKPDPLMFVTALRKLGLGASDVIMLGDSMLKDIVGARNLGIAAWPVKTYQVSGCR